MNDFFKIKEELRTSANISDELKLKIKNCALKLIHYYIYDKSKYCIINFELDKENFMNHMEFIYDKLKEYVNEVYEQNAERYYGKIVLRDYRYCENMFKIDVETFLKKKCLEIPEDERVFGKSYRVSAMGLGKYENLFSYEHYLHEKNKLNQFQTS